MEHRDSKVCYARYFGPARFVLIPKWLGTIFFNHVNNLKFQFLNGGLFVYICKMSKFIAIPNLFQLLFYAIKCQVVLTKYTEMKISQIGHPVQML